MAQYSRFDLGLLHAMDALLSERSVTRAAAKLYVSQPAMSGTLQRLREYFDDPLLVRAGREMELTPRAAALQMPVRELILSARSALETEPVFDPTIATRTFRLILSDYMGVVFMPALLRALERAAPNIRVQIEPLTQEGFRHLISGDADMCVTTDNWKLVEPNNLGAEMSRELLFEDSFVCAVGRDNPLVQDELTLEQYLSMPHIVTRFSAATSTIEEFMLERSDMGFLIGATAPGFIAPLFMLEGTRFIATVQSKLARKLAPAVDFRTFHPPLEIPVLRETMSWHPRNDADPGLTWLRGFMKKIALEDID